MIEHFYSIIRTNGLRIDWIKPYRGQKPGKSRSIYFNELKSYKYEPSYNFTTLKFRLMSGEKIRLHRWFFDDSKDEFGKFMTAFRRAVANHSKKKSTERPIGKEKLIMENKVFLWSVAIIIGLMLVATIALVIIKGAGNVKGIIAVLGVLGPLIWVGTSVLQGLRKK